MTPREELLAAVAILEKRLAIGHLAPIEPEARIVRDWLQLEADQYWRINKRTGEGSGTRLWDLVHPPDWVAKQPCIRMARLINGTEGP